MRRAKALFFSRCESCPVDFVPTGSNWSRRGGNEAAEASGVEGSVRNLANMQAVTRVNTEQASKRVDAEADPAKRRGRPPPQVKRTERAACGSAGVLVTACMEEGNRRNTGNPALWSNVRPTGRPRGTGRAGQGGG